MNIILTGYRATGKTTIGKALAKRLKREFIDSDDVIEKRTGKKIKDIFQEHGWKYFRRIEKKVVKDLSKLDNKIIAVGGGTFMYKDNLILKNNAFVFLLIAPIEVISERMKSDINRPPLSDAQSAIEEIKEVWNRRKERYYAVCDMVINTGDGDVNRAVAEIVNKLSSLKFI